MPLLYSTLPTGAHRDSLELASLASSSHIQDEVTEDQDSRGSLSSRRLSLEDDEGLGQASPDTSAKRGRTYSSNSTFDFAANLFPLSSSANGAARYAPLGDGLLASAAAGRRRGVAGGVNSGLGAAQLEKHKTLTYLNGLSLIVGLIIGSGIFSSPSQVSEAVGSPGASLIVWVVAGVLAWTGAASFAELGGAIPLNGGAQVYLAKIFGEMAGFLFTWVAVLVLRPGSAAIVSIIMGEYLVRAAIGAEAEHVNPWVIKGVALAGLFLVTFLNCVSTRLGTRMNDALMFMKFLALLGVSVTGVVVAATGYSFEGKASSDWKEHEWFEGTKLDASAWAVALYAGLWAFDGWDNTNYVVGELRNPSRDLPRVIHTAMPLVIVCYLLANVAYYLVLPLQVINSSNTVAVMFGAQVFGPAGSLVLALIVSASCFGSLNSSTFTSSRLVYVAGKEGYVPAVFGRIGTGSETDRHGGGVGGSLNATTLSSRSSWFADKLARWVGDEDTGLFFTPLPALALNGGLTATYVVVGEFRTLLTFYGVAGYTFYFLTVLGLIVLRVREPDLERPYRTWIVTPIVFCCVSLFLLSRAVFAQPMQTLAVVGFVVVGVPVYFLRTRARDGPVKREAGGEAQNRAWWQFWRRLGT